MIAVSRRPYSLDVARAFGAAETILMDDHAAVIGAVKELTGGALCERVVEAVGKQGPLDLAGELTAERGRLIVAGYHQDGPRQVNLWLWNWRGLDVINAHERDPKVYVEGMRAAVEAVAAGRLDPEPPLHACLSAAPARRSARRDARPPRRLPQGAGDPAMTTPLAGAAGAASLARPRVGFLGTGWIGRHRLQAIVETGAVTVAAIADAVARCGSGGGPARAGGGARRKPRRPPRCRTSTEWSSPLRAPSMPSNASGR